ncbi:hypothetical protein LCGC14_2761540, partial [marine sediment metagenome]
MPATAAISLIEEFLDYVLRQRNYSAHTARAYQADLAQFGLFLLAGDGAAALDGPAGKALAELDDRQLGQMERSLLGVGHADVRAYLAMLRSKGNSKATAARKLAALRSLYKFLVRSGRLAASPVAAVRTPKQDKRLPKFLDEAQVEALLAAPQAPGNVAEDASAAKLVLIARDRAILETIYSAGLRIGELTGLNVGDMESGGQTLRVRGKGRKERIVPLGSVAAAAVEEYLRGRDAAFGASDEPERALFINHQGNRLSARSVRRMLDKYIRQAGL